MRDDAQFEVSSYGFRAQSLGFGMRDGFGIGDDARVRRRRRRHAVVVRADGEGAARFADRVSDRVHDPPARNLLSGCVSV